MPKTLKIQNVYRSLRAVVLVWSEGIRDGKSEAVRAYLADSANGMMCTRIRKLGINGDLILKLASDPRHGISSLASPPIRCFVSEPIVIVPDPKFFASAPTSLPQGFSRSTVSTATANQNAQYFNLFGSEDCSQWDMPRSLTLATLQLSSSVYLRLTDNRSCF